MSSRFDIVVVGGGAAGLAVAASILKRRAALDLAIVEPHDGYGSCPLTVEKGKIVLAEFGYEGRLLPSFPKWLIDPVKPSRLAWLLKSVALPWIYWNGMLKGREWLVKPQ